MRIREKIDSLAETPKPPAAKALSGSSKRYVRLRIGDYRIIYRIDRKNLTVLVVKVGHRRDVYRNLT